MSDYMKKTISWLHLSDFHIRAEKEWEQDVVLNSLAEDIKDRFSETNKPNLLLLSGDISFSGQEDQYLLAEKFVRNLMSVTGIQAGSVFVVPGNHDIDRNIEEDAFDGARSKLKDSNSVDRFFSNADRQATLFKRQKAFRDFVNRLAPPEPTYTENSFAHTKTVSVGSINVRVLLIDSAWLSEGNNRDQGSLVMGERQLHAVCNHGGPPAIIFALAHHPISWLQSFEQAPIKNLLVKHASIFFHGHIHRDEAHLVSLHDNRIAILTAGATFENRLSRNSYGWGCVDLETGMVKTICYKYVPSEYRWEPADEESWRLVDPESISISIDQVFETVSARKGTIIHQPAYLTCLLTAKVSEIPTSLNGNLIYVSTTTNIGDEGQVLAKAILQLRQMFRWRDVWEPKDWDCEADRVFRRCQVTLDDLEKQHQDLREHLITKETSCAQIIKHLGHGTETISPPLLNQIADLSNAGDLDSALAITNRALGSNILDPIERIKLEKNKICFLLSQASIPEAIEGAEVLISSHPDDPEVFNLASTCYYADKNYGAASRSMHKALDLGLDPKIAKTLAHQIAGMSGDSALVKRVKNG